MGGGDVIVIYRSSDGCQRAPLACHKACTPTNTEKSSAKTYVRTDGQTHSTVVYPPADGQLWHLCTIWYFFVKSASFRFFPSENDAKYPGKQNHQGLLGALK